MLTAAGVQVNRFHAEGAGFTDRCDWNELGFTQSIVRLHHEEHGEGDDHEGERVVDEEPVPDQGRPSFSRGRKGGVIRPGEAEVQLGEIDSAGQQPDRRHEDVVHERLHNRPESGSDHYADGKVDDVATIDEVSKFLQHLHLQAINGSGWAGAQARQHVGSPLRRRS
jgi:hypothetical protein